MCYHGVTSWGSCYLERIRGASCFSPVPGEKQLAQKNWSLREYLHQKFGHQLVSVVLTALMFSLGGCSSKLISAPGITGRFVEEASGEPIAAVGVRYTNIGEDLSKETTTDSDGRFIFEPEFTYGYSGYPTSPVSLQVRLELLNRDKYNWSASGYFVNNTDIDEPIINAGEIRVNKVFLNPVL